MAEKNDKLIAEHERFLRMFTPVRERLWRFVRAWTRASKSSVDDIMGEIVLRTYEGMNSVRNEDSFTAFCFTIARRVILQHRNRQQSYIKTTIEYNPENHEQHSKTPTPDIEVDIGFLYNALALLPDKTKEALILFEISGYSLEEIRVIQGGSLSGVKNRLARGRVQLVSMLGEHIRTTTKIEQKENE